MKNSVQSLTWLASLMILSMAVQSCSDGKGQSKTIPSRSEAIPVKVTALEKSSSAQVVVASGRITTEDETILSFKIGGIVDAVYVKEGDRVRKGQLLARLDHTEINASVAQARHGYEKAQRDFDRVQNLYRDSVATLEQWQNAQTALEVAREVLAAADFNKSHAEIHAPANGFVLSKFANPGQVVGTGERILICNGAANDAWILKVGVSDKQWAMLAIDEKATVTIDAFPGKSFEAFISRKAETVDPQTGTFNIELKLKPAGVKLATGMFGSASIQSAQTAPHWSVPYDAVLDASGNEGFVFITNDGKTAHKQPVRVASFNGQQVNVDQGLEKAQWLIVAGSAYLSDNSPIQIIK